MSVRTHLDSNLFSNFSPCLEEHSEIVSRLDLLFPDAVYVACIHWNTWVEGLSSGFVFVGLLIFPEWNWYTSIVNLCFFPFQPQRLICFLLVCLTQADLILLSGFTEGCPIIQGDLFKQIASAHLWLSLHHCQSSPHTLLFLIIPNLNETYRVTYSFHVHNLAEAAAQQSWANGLLLTPSSSHSLCIVCTQSLSPPSINQVQSTQVTMLGSLIIFCLERQKATITPLLKYHLTQGWLCI